MRSGAPEGLCWWLSLDNYSQSYWVIMEHNVNVFTAYTTHAPVSSALQCTRAVSIITLPWSSVKSVPGWTGWSGRSSRPLLLPPPPAWIFLRLHSSWIDAWIGEKTFQGLDQRPAGPPAATANQSRREAIQSQVLESNLLWRVLLAEPAAGWSDPCRFKLKLLTWSAFSTTRSQHAAAKFTISAEIQKFSRSFTGVSVGPLRELLRVFVWVLAVQWFGSVRPACSCPLRSAISVLRGLRADTLGGELLPLFSFLQKLGSSHTRVQTAGTHTYTHTHTHTDTQTRSDTTPRTLTRVTFNSEPARTNSMSPLPNLVIWSVCACVCVIMSTYRLA